MYLASFFGQDNFTFLILLISIASISLALWILWLLMLIHAIKSKNVNKAAWITILILAPGYIGTFIYYFIIYRKQKKHPTRATGEGTNLGTISAVKTKSRTLTIWAIALIVLAVIGLISLAIQALVAPINHVYAPKSLDESYVLTRAESGKFNDIPYVELIYENGDKQNKFEKDGVIRIREFEQYATKFSPPVNCGFYHPMNRLYGEKVYGSVECKLEKQIGDILIYIPTGNYGGDYINKEDAANYYIVYRREIIAISSPVSLDVAVGIATSLQDTNLIALKKKIKPVTSTTSCQSTPIAGELWFDFDQPIAYNDERPGEIARSINATNYQSRSGKIVNSEDNLYLEGKFWARVPVGTEAAAIAKIKTFPNISYAAQAVTYCPPQQPDIKVTN